MEEARPIVDDLEPNQRRSVRNRTILSEQNQTEDTPKVTSADEQVIIQRGPRKKPLTWSPYEHNRCSILGPTKDKTPEKTGTPSKPTISAKIRRRLILSNEKDQDQKYYDDVIAKRLRSFSKGKDITPSSII